MNLFLHKVSSEEWNKLSTSVHAVSFGLDRKPEQDRIDYALMVSNSTEPCAYCTVIEIDRDSCYMQHGGVMPNIAGTVNVAKSFMMITNKLKEEYGTISTRILNTNTAMIKIEISGGFLITGCELNDGDLFLNLLWKKNWKTQYAQ